MSAVIESSREDSRVSEQQTGRGRKGTRRSQAPGKRRRAREMALQMLYQQELGSSALNDVFESFDLVGYGDEDDAPASFETLAPRQQRLTREAFDYARRLVEGSRAHGEEIDELIRQHAENWRLERMPTIDRSILRLAVYEMLHETSVPRVVIVDEAIELAKKYGSENSGRFVNGLLDGILQSRGTEAVEEAGLPG